MSLLPTETLLRLEERMRALAVFVFALPLLITVAFAQNNPPPVTRGERAIAVKRENAELENARLIEQLRHSNLRMQAKSTELEKLAQQGGNSARERTPALQGVEQQHPEWFEETNAYKPCPWNMCPSPPPQ
jgi:hypothetical protein